MIEATVIVDLPEDPGASVRLEGLTEMEKSGTPVPETFTVTFAE